MKKIDLLIIVLQNVHEFFVLIIESTCLPAGGAAKFWRGPPWRAQRRRRTGRMGPGRPGPSAPGPAWTALLPHNGAKTTKRCSKSKFRGYYYEKKVKVFPYRLYSNGIVYIPFYFIKVNTVNVHHAFNNIVDYNILLMQVLMPAKKYIIFTSHTYSSSQYTVICTVARASTV
jgi:hypothetical protein